jgi:hypothetical protein
MIGFIPQEGVDEMEYRDYVTHMQRMDKDTFETQLKIGTLPPGLVILPDGRLPGVIVGRGADQHCELIDYTKGIRI